MQMLDTLFQISNKTKNVIPFNLFIVVAWLVHCTVLSSAAIYCRQNTVESDQAIGGPKLAITKLLR